MSGFLDKSLPSVIAMRARSTTREEMKTLLLIILLCYSSNSVTLNLKEKAGSFRKLSSEAKNSAVLSLALLSPLLPLFFAQLLCCLNVALESHSFYVVLSYESFPPLRQVAQDWTARGIYTVRCLKKRRWFIKGTHGSPKSSWQLEKHRWLKICHEIVV